MSAPSAAAENKKKPSSEYHARSDNLLQLHQCKGVPAVARENLLFEHYLSILTEKNKCHKVNYNKLSSNAHTIHQIKQRKLALTSFEDKRQLLNCSIHTKPYGDSSIVDFRCLICNKYKIVVYMFIWVKVLLNYVKYN